MPLICFTLLFQAFYKNNFVEKGQLEAYKQELEAKVCKHDFVYQEGCLKGVFTLGARVLVPGHRQKIVLRSDSIQVQCKVETLYPGTGRVTEFWCNYFEKKRCVHITASENRTRVPCTVLGT